MHAAFFDGRGVYMGIIFWIAYILFTFVFAVILELNHNTLSGWLFFLAAAIMFVFLYGKAARSGRWFVKCLFFLLYAAVFASIVFFTWPPVKAVPAVNVKNPEVTDVVMTENGALTGVYNKDKTVEVYAGIPYAKPPVGELRWKKPQKADSWEGVLACDTFAPMSMQAVNTPIMDSLTQIVGYHDYKISLSDNYRTPVSEDSLYLNIWKPAGAQENLPVIVYIHGGSLQTGQPWYADYSGEGFARSGVITVNMGYRLGVFGFFGDEELLEKEGTAGNFGLLDQIMALEWVRDNISAFGGDPDNVTLVGESAGAVCVDALCVSDLSQGLFRRAVLESSTISSSQPPHSYRSLDDTLNSAEELKKRYGCTSIDELRQLPAEKIVGEMNTQHHVTVDGYVLKDNPYRLRKQGVHNEEAIFHGFNSQESGPFIIFSHAKMKNYEEKIRRYFADLTEEVLGLYPAENDEEADRYWAEIYGAVFFNYPHYCLNRLAASQGIPVYEYLFDKSNGRLGAWHSGELVYAFGVIPEESKLYDEKDRSLSELMHAYWVNFAKTGDPNVLSLPLLEENSSSQRIMRFSDNPGMTDEPYVKLYEILDRVYGFELE